MADDTRLLREDRVARAEALDISRSFIVQAPAGSGKTELLIQRYLKLLAAVSAPEEVLAITFTRKAAAEMQVRVLAALQAAADGVEPDAEHEQVTARAARHALAADRDHGWHLLDNPSRMRIQTLDSLNATIARKQPMTAVGGASENRIVADAAVRALYHEAAALTLDQLAETGVFREAARDVLLHLDANAGLYVRYLAQMLQTRDQWLPFVGSGNLDPQESESLRAYLEEGLERAVTRELQAIVAAFPREQAPTLIEIGRYAASNLAVSGEHRSDIAVLADLDELPGVSAGDRAAWSGIADLLLTGQGEYRKQVNKNQGFPAGINDPKDAFAQLVAALASLGDLKSALHNVRSLPPLHYSDEQWSVLVALFRLLPLAAVELKRLFTERGIVDHIEVALSASTALGTAEAPGDVALLLDYQVRHLLVDEMQDTSAAQYRMIEALTGGWQPGDGRTLYCVGDPMQSIYRFRNAEVGQFLLSKEAGIGSVELTNLTLRRNFRSGAGLVDWFNAVFPGVLPARDDAQRSAVSYEPAAPVPELSDSGICNVHPVIGADAVAEAEVGLELLNELLQQFPEDDIAVLVRGRSHLTELLRRLRSQGIGYRAVEIDRLTDLPEIIDALALTRALVHQGDRHAWLALLRSPWVGLSWADLHALVLNDRDTAIWELLNDDQVLVRLSPAGRNAVDRFAKTIATSLRTGRIETLRERVERAWFALGGPGIPDDPDAIDNVYHFLDVVEDLEVAGDLPDVADLEATLDAERVSSTAASRIQVMTMHRAKGLQFDHVVLFGLGRIPRPRDTNVMSWFDLPDEHGRPLKVISPIGPRAELDKDPIHSYIGKVDAEMNDNEVGRLLYVACTRARKSLHLVGNTLVFKSGMRPDKRSLLYRLWPAVRARFEEEFDPDIGGGENTTTAEWLLPVLRRFDSGWEMPEPPPLTTRARLPSVEEGAVEFQWVGAEARIAGTLVHRWLQFVVQQGMDIDGLDYPAIQSVSGRWAREMGISAAQAQSVIDRTMNALEAMSGDKKGRWLLSADGHAELALTGVVDGRTESVVLDRVLVDDEGVHWIVDYKTSSHEGGDLGRFLDEEARRYRDQLTRYADLYRSFAGVEPRCALYFPLLQEFVEIVPLDDS